MHHDIIDVIRNIQDLYENNSNLAVLKDVERVLDELDLYVYKNWEDGELAYGPKVERHWITVGFMWPSNRMPDPSGAKRLIDLGCKVTYQKTHLVEPRKIRTPDDIRPGSKKGKLQHNPIWVVEIMMPKKLAFDIYKGYMDKMKNEYKETQSNSNSPAMPPAATPPAMPPAMPPMPAAPAGGAAPGAAPSAPV